MKEYKWQIIRSITATPKSDSYTRRLEVFEGFHLIYWKPRKRVADDKRGKGWSELKCRRTWTPYASRKTFLFVTCGRATRISLNIDATDVGDVLVVSEKWMNIPSARVFMDESLFIWQKWFSEKYVFIHSIVSDWPEIYFVQWDRNPWKVKHLIFLFRERT